MGTDSSKRIDEIFGEALELATDARDAFLKNRCGDDECLLRDVRRLLRHIDRAGPGFLERAPMVDGLRGMPPSEIADPLVSRIIGDYKVKNVIARGGMGTVYLAEQGHPRRTVALKVLHAGLWSRSAEKRFEFESQVLARLQHPHIAQVYEAGTVQLGHERTRSISFFAMEYVQDARTITHFAREGALDTPDRLALFIQICAAVHHGHQKGIIHRDLKPANILVDAAGHVKIIDFGVARVIDSDVAMTTMHTETGQLIGTLAYMSPEQCEADPLGLDVRSDVYSLGVVLYELLCGRLPYEVSSTSIIAAARAIREAEPARPSAVTGRGTPIKSGASVSTVKGDLESIILKCLEKDRTKRYQTTAELSSDILNYLDGEPISARAPTVWTKALRWAARRPKAATTILCLGISALVVLSTFISVFLLDIRPAQIVRNAEWSEARLVAMNGRAIHRWSGGGEHTVSYGELVRSPPELGGRRLALLGFTNAGDLHRGELCAFDINEDMEKPHWTRTITRDQMPPESRFDEKLRQGYGVYRVRLVDVFPESPGAELIVIWSHANSQWVLQILDLEGRLLYQIWQDGGIWDFDWMPDAHLLVLLGADEEVKVELQNTGAKEECQGLVAIGIQPQYGFIARQYIHHDPGEGPLHPKWYRYFSPPSSEAFHYSIQFTSDVGGFERGSHVGIDIQAGSKEHPEGISLMLDQSGQAISERRTTDRWNANRLTLPKSDLIQLRDKPPTALWRGDQRQ